MILREYASRDGVVFAIAWKGLKDSELGPLLGSYAAEYERADQHAIDSARGGGGSRVRCVPRGG
jgi:hypothetical protein